MVQARVASVVFVTQIRSLVTKTLLFGCSCVLVIALGLLCGQHLIPQRPRASFDVHVWPSRGSGESLVEYFDPSCALSRQTHSDLDLIYAKSPTRFRQTMVLISMQPRPPEPWAAAICATSSDDVWRLASEVARGSSKPVSPSTDQCRQRVRVATQHTIELQGQLGAPLVEFRGKLYRGYREVTQLEELLR
jgi:hypothetical protein